MDARCKWRHTGKITKIRYIATLYPETMARTRKISPIPNGPNFNIPQEYAITGEEQQFLQYDNGREDRVLIFGTRDSLDYLENGRNWFMDGTFSVSSPQFAQLYTAQWKKRSWSVYFVTKQKIR